MDVNVQLGAVESLTHKIGKGDEHSGKEKATEFI